VSPDRHLATPPGMPRRASRALACVIAGLIVTGVSAALPVAAAQAATVTPCPGTTLVQPFVKWGDEGYYSLVGGGSFEGSTAGWTLSGGAKVAAGGEPSTVGGSLGLDSLKLPAGAAAQSPFTCVEPSDRTFRFFARSEGSMATIIASVVYETVLGDSTVVAKQVVLMNSWEPSPIIHTGAAKTIAIKKGVAYLSLHFTATSGTARIDDVYLDPRMR
jgi:hypothetical protein